MARDALEQIITSQHPGLYSKSRKRRSVRGGAWYDFLDPHKNGVGNLYNKVKHEVVTPDSVLRGQYIPKAASFADKALAASAVVPGLGQIVAPVAAGVKAVAKANDVAKAFGYGRYDPITPEEIADLKARRAGYARAIRSTISGATLPPPNAPSFSPGNAAEQLAHWNETAPRRFKVNHAAQNFNAVDARLAATQAAAKLPPGMDRDVLKMAGYGRKVRAPSHRNMLVRDVMRKMKLSLPEASKYIKAHGL